MILSLFGMVERRVKKVLAWIIALAVLGVLAAGVFYILVVWV